MSIDQAKLSISLTETKENTAFKLRNILEGRSTERIFVEFYSLALLGGKWLDLRRI